MRLTRLLAPLVTGAALAATPAFSAEPLEIVQALYDNHVYGEMAPGGMELWSADMQALWQKLAADEALRLSGALDFMGEGLTYDFMINSQEDYFADLKLKESRPTEGEAVVRAMLDNGGDEPIQLLYHFFEMPDGWRIAEVTLEGGELLSEEIKATR